MIQCSYEYNTLLLLFSIREQAKKNTQLFSLLVFIMKLISTSGEHKHVFWFSLCRQVSAKEAAEALRSLQPLSLWARAPPAAGLWQYTNIQRLTSGLWPTIDVIVD